MLEALGAITAEMPDLRVITSFGGKAVVRCSPSEKDAVTAEMSRAFPGSESLITSGTLRKIREIYPELKVPQKKKR